jgi:hypothetical protein
MGNRRSAMGFAGGRDPLIVLGKAPATNFTVFLPINPSVPATAYSR